MRRVVILIALTLAARPDAALGQKKDKKRGPDFPRIANFYGAGIQAGMLARDPARLDFAAKYDLIVGGVLHDADQEIQYLKQKNPDLTLLKYISVRGRRTSDTQMRPEWWLNDPQGQPVHPWPDVNLVNETNPLFNKYLIYTAKLVLDKQPLFDGIFLDSFGDGISYLNNGALDANMDGRKDDPAWLDEEWKKGLLRVAEGISKLRDGKAVVVANGSTPLKFGFDYLNGCLVEDAMARVMQGRADWQETIGGYLRWFDVLRKPRITAVVSGGGAIEDPWKWRQISQEERDAEAERAHVNYSCMRFGLCATLMGDGYYGYDYQTTCRGQFWWYKEFDAPLGYPRGAAFARHDGAWQREYDGGSVVVNPTARVVTVSFAGERKDSSTDQVGTEFSVPGYDGRIFLVLEPGPESTDKKQAPPK